MTEHDQGDLHPAFVASLGLSEFSEFGVVIDTATNERIIVDKKQITFGGLPHCQVKIPQTARARPYDARLLVGDGKVTVVYFASPDTLTLSDGQEFQVGCRTFRYLSQPMETRELDQSIPSAVPMDTSIFDVRRQLNFDATNTTFDLGGFDGIFHDQTSLLNQTSLSISVDNSHCDTSKQTEQTSAGPIFQVSTAVESEKEVDTKPSVLSSPMMTTTESLLNETAKHTRSLEFARNQRKSLCFGSPIVTKALQERFEELQKECQRSARRATATKSVFDTINADPVSEVAISANGEEEKQPCGEEGLMEPSSSLGPSSSSSFAGLPAIGQIENGLQKETSGTEVHEEPPAIIVTDDVPQAVSSPVETSEMQPQPEGEVLLSTTSTTTAPVPPQSISADSLSSAVSAENPGFWLTGGTDEPAPSHTLAEVAVLDAPVGLVGGHSEAHKLPTISPAEEPNESEMPLALPVADSLPSASEMQEGLAQDTSEAMEQQNPPLEESHPMQDEISTTLPVVEPSSETEPQPSQPHPAASVGQPIVTTSGGREKAKSTVPSRRSPSKMKTLPRVATLSRIAAKPSASSVKIGQTQQQPKPKPAATTTSIRKPLPTLPARSTVVSKPKPAVAMVAKPKPAATSTLSHPTSSSSCIAKPKASATAPKPKAAAATSSASKLAARPWIRPVMRPPAPPPQTPQTSSANTTSVAKLGTAIAIATAPKALPSATRPTPSKMNIKNVSSRVNSFRTTAAPLIQPTSAAKRPGAVLKNPTEDAPPAKRAKPNAATLGRTPSLKNISNTQPAKRWH